MEKPLDSICGISCISQTACRASWKDDAGCAGTRVNTRLIAVSSVFLPGSFSRVDVYKRQTGTQGVSWKTRYHTAGDNIGADGKQKEKCARYDV